MRRVHYKLHGVKYYAICQDDEKPIDAVIRSMKQKPGVAHVSFGSIGVGVNRAGLISSREYYLSVCGPKDKTGGWPVVAEMRLSLPE